MTQVPNDQQDNLKLEKKIMNISFAGSILFLLAEIFFAIWTGSKAVLMDCVYDLADLAMIGPFMLLVPLLYKKETEKRPYGFSQIESLFVLIKYIILLGIDTVLVINCIQTIISGGNEVEADVLAIFEIAISAGCVLMWFLLKHFARKYQSPSIKAELFIWKLDALCTLGVGAAFVINLILIHTPLAWICPYIDPGIAVILAISLVGEPVEMILESLRSLVLFAPEKEVFEKIDQVCIKHMAIYDCEVTFTDVIKTGRKIWIQVFFTHNDEEREALNIGRLKNLRKEITEELAGEFDNIDIVLIPDLADGFRQVELAEPPARRKDKIAYIESQEQKKEVKKKAKAAKNAIKNNNERGLKNE
ncbi:MAG: cation transporter [Clostridia bacterium]|nr:cation transporter [Clostridia bacterium]